MLVRIAINANVAEVEEAESILFASLPIGLSASKTTAHEADLEDLLAANVDLIEGSGDGDDTLLIIGRQVKTSSGKVMDLVALDSSGALSLIEVKRDEKDVKVRKDHAEIQSVRYAASLARLRTADDLVMKLYAPYIERYQAQDHAANGGARSSVEWARKKLADFIDTNKIPAERINHSQKIVLIGAGFDEDTKSAAAWMAKNGLPLRVVEVRPYSVGPGNYVLDIQQVIPPLLTEDFYVDVTSAGTARRRAATGAESGRTSRLKLKDLLAAGVLKVGDAVWFKGKPDKQAYLTPDGGCSFEGSKMSLSSYSKAISGWSGVNNFAWIHHGPSDRLLGQLREEVESKQFAEEQALEAKSLALNATVGEDDARNV